MRTSSDRCSRLSTSRSPRHRSRRTLQCSPARPWCVRTPSSSKTFPAHRSPRRAATPTFTSPAAGPASRGLDGFEPSHLVKGNVEALALVGRATSSLPGLFEPVEVRAATFGSRLVGGFTRLRDEVEVMDGGVIDNVPISRAIRAIANSPAECTRPARAAVPPSRSGWPAGAAADRRSDDCAEGGGVVLRQAQGDDPRRHRAAPGAQRRGRSAARRRRVAAAIVRCIRLSASMTTSALELAQSVCSAMLLRAAIDPPSELHVACAQRRTSGSVDRRTG